MLEPIHSFIFIIAFFFIFLGLKKATKRKFCVICISFSTIWVLLGIAYLKGLFESFYLIAIMAGMTLHGIYKITEKRISRKYEVYKLPGLLTGLIFTYIIFSQDFQLSYLALIGFAWIFFLLLFSYRENERFESFIDELIECCKDW